MQLALFIIFGALAVAGALNLLLQRHPINSALSLVVVMMSLAVLYWSLGAEFLAAALSGNFSSPVIYDLRHIGPASGDSLNGPTPLGRRCSSALPPSGRGCVENRIPRSQ